MSKAALGRILPYLRQARMNPRELGLNILGLCHWAESGSAVAQIILGTCYLEGVQVGIDHRGRRFTS
jgi:hypothetical protein